MLSLSGKHGHGARGVAPVSDATTREGCCCLRVGVASNFFFHDSRRLMPMQRKLGPIHIESGWFALTRAISIRIGWNHRNVRRSIHAEIQ